MITIRVADSYPICATRERGRKFLQECTARLESAQDVVFSFDGVEFVSPSFLDEAVLNLVLSDALDVSNVWLENLSEHAINSLQVLIRARNARVHLTKESNGRVVASAG